jgi:hypothetical protein
MSGPVYHQFMARPKGAEENKPLIVEFEGAKAKAYFVVVEDGAPHKQPVKLKYDKAHNLYTFTADIEINSMDIKTLENCGCEVGKTVKQNSPSEVILYPDLKSVRLKWAAGTTGYEQVLGQAKFEEKVETPEAGKPLSFKGKNYASFMFDVNALDNFDNETAFISNSSASVGIKPSQENQNMSVAERTLFWARETNQGIEGWQAKATAFLEAAQQSILNKFFSKPTEPEPTQPQAEPTQTPPKPMMYNHRG